jgi:hypothetical protein
MKTLLAAIVVLCAPALARAYDPTDHYEKRAIEGWTLYVHQDLLADKPLADRCLALLQVKLFDLQRVVPAAAVARLKEVPIWLELNDPKFPGACYHPSKQWLETHDVNPDKTGGVEIANARNFLTWTLDQPWMVLHELAHAYHHRVLGHDNADIKAAFKAAKESGKYDKVLHINGRVQKHYAMNNDQEYFAESTEAFFGVNDFYPFVRAELKEFDPQMYEVLKKVWGVVKAAPATRTAATRAVGSALPPP